MNFQEKTKKQKAQISNKKCRLYVRFFKLQFPKALNKNMILAGLLTLTYSSATLPSPF